MALGRSDNNNTRRVGEGSVCCASLICIRIRVLFSSSWVENMPFATGHAQRWGVTLTQEVANFKPMFPCTYPRREDMIYFLHKDHKITLGPRGTFECYECIWSWIENDLKVVIINLLYIFKLPIPYCIFQLNVHGTLWLMYFLPHPEIYFSLAPVMSL